MTFSELLQNVWGWSPVEAEAAAVHYWSTLPFAGTDAQCSRVYCECGLHGVVYSPPSRYSVVDQRAFRTWCTDLRRQFVAESAA